MKKSTDLNQDCLAVKQHLNSVEKHESYIKRLTDGVDLNAVDEKDRWHFERKLGIGGSDVAAILGIDKFKTALQVWEEKTGRTEPEDLSDNERVHFGNVLEDVVAKEYALRTGSTVERRNRPFTHPGIPWLRANIDRHIIGADKGLECKTSDKWANRDAWGKGNVYQSTGEGIIISEQCDEVPDTYILQQQHYMIVLSRPQWDLAALIGGNDFRIYTMDFNPDLAKLLIKKLHDFWFNYVIADIAPPAQNLQDLESLHQHDNGLSITATPEIINKYREFKAIKDQIKALETEAYGPLVGGDRIGGLDFEIKQFLGDNAELLLDDEGKKLCSWKTQSSKRIDTTLLKKAHPGLVKEFTKTIESRVFRT